MKKKILIITSIILVIALLVGGFLLFRDKKQDIPVIDDIVASVITIDVNPSIEINLNKNNEVISINALNEDSKKLLKNKKFKDKGLEETLVTLIDLLKENNYLNSDTNTILINVDTDNENLSSIVEDSINKITKEKGINTEIIMLAVLKTPELKELADQNNISISKAYYIQEQIKDEDNLTIADLKDASINDITKMIEEYKKEQENIISETESNNKSTESNTNTNTTNNNNSSSSRTGSLTKCEKIKEAISREDAASKAVSTFGARLNPAGYCDVRDASSVASLAPDGTCAFKVDFEYRINKCTYYIDIATGEVMNSSYCAHRDITMGDNQCIIMKDLNTKHRENLQLVSEVETADEFVSVVDDGYGTMNTYEYHISKLTGEITAKIIVKEFDGPPPYNENNPRPDDI